MKHLPLNSLVLCSSGVSALVGACLQSNAAPPLPPTHPRNNITTSDPPRDPLFRRCQPDEHGLYDGRGPRLAAKCYGSGCPSHGPRRAEGITVFGQVDYAEARARNNAWQLGALNWFLVPKQAIYPDPFSWPVNESYWDIHQWPGACEFTPQKTMGNVSYMWGYLSAESQADP